MVDLPHPDEPFAGVINPLARDSTPARPAITSPPAGAPNVVVVLLDDVGFGTASTFGGPSWRPRRWTCWCGSLELRRSVAR